MTQHELADDAVPDPALPDHLKCSRADLGEVLVRLGGTQEGEIASPGAWGLKGVIYVGQSLAHQRPAPVAVNDPQVLEGGDVTEIPHERAHQLRMDALEVLVGDRGDERERPLARLRELVDDPRLSGRLRLRDPRCVPDVHCLSLWHQRSFGKPSTS